MLSFDKPHGVFFGREKITPEEVERIKEFARKAVPDNPEKVKDIDLVVKCVQQTLPEAINELIVALAGTTDKKLGDDDTLNVSAQILLPAYILETIARIHDLIDRKELPIEPLLDFFVNEMVLRGFEAEYQRVAKKYSPFGPGKVTHYLASLIRFSFAPVKDIVDKLLH